MGRPRDERGLHGWPESRSDGTAATTAAGGVRSLHWFVSSDEERGNVVVESRLKVEEKIRDKDRRGKVVCGPPRTHVLLSGVAFGGVLVDAGPAWRAIRPNGSAGAPASNDSLKDLCWFWNLFLATYGPSILMKALTRVHKAGTRIV